jgi:threonine/homoserine/homoserine lactone efflux protein
MFISGFKFGMMLQFAVGPVCLYILKISLSSSLTAALSGMVGVTLVDSLFVILAIFGIGNIITQSDKLSRYLCYVGGIILIVFGMLMLYSAFGTYTERQVLIETSRLTAQDVSNGHAFIKAALLTLSSPMTIIFWGGVFATKITNDFLSQRQLYIFGLGAVSSTAFSLTLVALIARQMTFLFNVVGIVILNSVVGILLVGYGVRQMRYKK